MTNSLAIAVPAFANHVYETINHVISEGSTLAQKEYKNKQNWGE